MILIFGKHKNEILANTPESYIKWLATHKAVLSVEHRGASDAAKELLEMREKAVEIEKAIQIDHIAAEHNFIAARELRMAKAAASQNKNDLSTNGNLYSNKGFSILR